MLFTWLLVLTFLQQSYGLTCLAFSSFSIPRDEFLSMHEGDFVQRLNEETANGSTESKACHVVTSVGFDPASGNVEIMFGQKTDRTDNDLTIQTTFPSEKESGQVFNYVELVCSTYDMCDRDFDDGCERQHM